MKKYAGNMKECREGSETWKNSELYHLYKLWDSEERSTEQSELRVVVHSFLPIQRPKNFPEIFPNMRSLGGWGPHEFQWGKGMRWEEGHESNSPVFSNMFYRRRFHNASPMHVYALGPENFPLFLPFKLQSTGEGASRHSVALSLYIGSETWRYTELSPPVYSRRLRNTRIPSLPLYV